jgi:hypothetical protein
LSFIARCAGGKIPNQSTAAQLRSEFQGVVASPSCGIAKALMSEIHI